MQDVGLCEFMANNMTRPQQDSHSNFYPPENFAHVDRCVMSTLYLLITLSPVHPYKVEIQ